jgi:hypothetical protein
MLLCSHVELTTRRYQHKRNASNSAIHQALPSTVRYFTLYIERATVFVDGCIRAGVA